ncbi:MAG: hypothetical protein KDK70_37330 [Myxococcales bacterium]|nr:hypothetical protein [Myxococcales bacterium]
MPLSPEQEWTLAACGLMAHADGILQAGEWNRVLWMLDERIGDDDASAWVSLLADRERLSAHLDGLAPPMPFFCEAILEKAWRMALADGEGSEQETAVHDALAPRLGVDLAEAARLRAHWQAQAHARSELVAGVAAILATLDGRLEPSELAALDRLLERLPTPAARRPALRAMREQPPALDDVVGELMALEPEERRLALLELVPLVQASGGGERERALLLDVAGQLAVPTDELERRLAG